MKNILTTNKNYNKGKKTVFLQLTAIVIIMALMSGCSQASKGKVASTSIDKAYFNSEYAKKGMKTVSNDAFDYDNEMLFGKFGMALGSPVVTKLLDRFSAFDSTDRIELLYFNDRSVELGKEVKGKDFESIDESLLQEMDNNNINYGAFFYIKDNDENAKVTLDEFKGKFSIVDPFAKNGEYTYYYAYNDNLSAYSNITLSDKDKVNLEKLIKDVPNIAKHSALFPFGENNVCTPMGVN